MESEFEECKNIVSEGSLKHVGQNDMLKLYGLYSVVTKGAAPEKHTSSLFDLRGSLKWKAWKEHSDLSRDEAQEQYIVLVRELESASEGDGKADGPRVVGMGMDASIKGFTVDANYTGGGSSEQRFDLTHWASVNDSRSIVFTLEKQNVSPDYRDEEGLTALMRAADRDACDALRVLLAAGADFAAKDPDGMTALHYATLCDHPVAAGLLAKAGADPLVLDNDGTSALESCSEEITNIIRAAQDGKWDDPSPLPAEMIPKAGSSRPLLPVLALIGAVLALLAAYTISTRIG